jgi:hypothetical protein
MHPFEAGLVVPARIDDRVAGFDQLGGLERLYRMCDIETKHMLPHDDCRDPRLGNTFKTTIVLPPLRNAECLNQVGNGEGTLNTYRRFLITMISIAAVLQWAVVLEKAFVAAWMWYLYATFAGHLTLGRTHLLFILGSGAAAATGYALFKAESSLPGQRFGGTLLSSVGHPLLFAQCSGSLSS